MSCVHVVCQAETCFYYHIHCLCSVHSYVNKDIKTEQFLSKSSKVVLENIDGELQKKIIEDLCITDECLTSPQTQSYNSDNDMENISFCIKKKEKNEKNQKNEDILLELQKKILINIYRG